MILKFSLNFYLFLRHSDDMIQRLEHAGLGYHIQAHQTTDKLGYLHFLSSILFALLSTIYDGDVVPIVELLVKSHEYLYEAEIWIKIYVPCAPLGSGVQSSG